MTNYPTKIIYMKNISLIILILLVAFSCTQNQENNQSSEISGPENEALKKIAPKNVVENMSILKAPKKEERVKTEAEPVSPRNRVQVVINQQVAENHVEFESNVKSFSNNKLLFANGAEVSFWLPETHKVNFTPKESLKVAFDELFISGAIFNSIQITDSKKRPVLNIISSGGESPVLSNPVEGISLQQTTKEKQLADNASETVGETEVLLNRKTPLVKNRPTELSINGTTYIISVNQSLHTVPKGPDSFDGPAYLLEYTITQK